jgi:serine O-acetyltransferase
MVFRDEIACSHVIFVFVVSWANNIIFASFAPYFKSTMSKSLIQKLHDSHRAFVELPAIDFSYQFIDQVLGFLFPEHSKERYKSVSELDRSYASLKGNLYELLMVSFDNDTKHAEEVSAEFWKQLPAVYELIKKDAECIYKGDPAAHSQSEVILTYPGFYSIAVYRLAHIFYQHKVPYFPRILAEYAHRKTGVDINPGATIGENFCIDHGTGIVIGETTVIGDNVKIYQGVTLGALSVEKTMAKTKRHPTLEDDVVIYSNATILGGETVIGKGSVVGGNVWLIESIPPFSRVYHKEEVVIK